MGARIIMPGANYEDSAIGFLPAVSTGLAGWWFLNGSLEKASRNLAPDGADASVVGEPTIQSGFLSLRSGTNFLLTDVRETNDLTLVCVARSSASFSSNPERPHFISNYLGSNTGAYISVSGTPSSAPAATVSSATYRDVSGTSTSGGSTISIPDLSVFKFLAGVHTEAMSSVYSLTDNLQTVNARTGTRILKPTVPFRIGSSEGTQYRGVSDIAFAAIYNRALSKAELDAIYLQVKAYMTLKGIAI